MIRWLIYLLPATLVSLACYLLTPMVALCVTRRLYTDTVKRLGRRRVTIARDFIVRPLYWFQTFDNAVDEYWWGRYSDDAPFAFIRHATQADYDDSRWIRYVCRVLWMWRNCAYGFMQYPFGRPLDEVQYVINRGDVAGFHYTFTKRKSSWQLEANIPIGFGRFNSVNIGWKPHDGFDRVMYANRVIGLRRYK